MSVGALLCAKTWRIYNNTQLLLWLKLKRSLKSANIKPRIMISAYSPCPPPTQMIPILTATLAYYENMKFILFSTIHVKLLTLVEADKHASVTLLLINLFMVLSANYVSHMPCTHEIHSPAQGTIVSLIRVLVDTDKDAVRED